MFDPALDASGGVIPGPGTQKALDEAAAAARESGSGRIFLSAGAPPDPRWKGETMARVCARYLQKSAPTVPVAMGDARTFNTLGELLALARYMKSSRGEDVRDVVITVKRWHAPRVRMLAGGIFARYSVRVPFELRTHPLPFSLRLLLHELAAFPKDWLRLCRMHESA